MRFIRRFMISAFSLIWISFFMPTCVFAENALEAELKLTNVDDLSSGLLRFATTYHIRIKNLSPGLTPSEIQNASTFNVMHKKTGKVVAVVPTEPGHDIEGERFMAAYLWGDFRTDVDYVLTIRYSDGKTAGPIDVIKDANVEKKESSFIQWVSDRLSYGVDIQDVGNTDGFAVTYNLDLILGKIFGNGYNHQYGLSFSAEGELSTNAEDKEIQSSMKEGLTFDYRYNAPVTIPVPQPKGKDTIKREYKYPIGFRLKPVEFEHNQDFELVNYTAKVQGVVTVPYSELPVFWWHAETGVSRPFYPLLFYAGYTRSIEASDESDVQEEANYNRLDLELVYNFPLAKKIDFLSRWRAFFNIDNGDNEDLLEIAAKIYTNSERTTGVIVKYENGALPPEFKGTSSMRVGFSYEFF